MVKITEEYLKIACQEHLNIAEQVKKVTVDHSVDIGLLEQDEFFEKALGLIYQDTRARQDTFWLWAAKDKRVVAFVVIEGSPSGIFVVYFKGNKQW